MAGHKLNNIFILTSSSSLDDTTKLLEEDTRIKSVKLLKSNILMFSTEIDEKFEIIFKMQEKIANLFYPDISYSLDYYIFYKKESEVDANNIQEIILLFGHSDREKVNNYKLTYYYKDGELYDSKPKDKNIEKLRRRYRDKVMFFSNYLTDMETAHFTQGMYVRFKMTFDNFNSISKEDFENIFNTIKNLKQTHYIEKTHRGFRIVAYIEDPSYDHILNKEIAENMFYKYDDIIRPQILEFGHDLIESIKNKINCDYKLTFATTNPGSFETMAGGVIIVKNDSDRPYIDICRCPKQNLEIDETVIDDETGRFEEYYHKVLAV